VAAAVSRPALTLPSRTLQAVAQGLRQLHGTPSSWADLLESFGAGVKAQMEPLLVELTREGAHPRLIATLLEELARARGELEQEREGWSFVWSGPKPLHNNVSDTWATITQLIEGAQSSLLIATHNIGLSRDCRDVFASLAERLATGSLKEVQIFFHPKQIDQELGHEPLPQISRWFDRRIWPWQPKPLAFIDRRLLIPSAENCYQHAKAVVADAGTAHAKALLTSANFSETAQRYNFEAGCLITLPWQVDKLAGHYRSLVDQGYFIRLLQDQHQGG
jgi:phosphatidylserine/phosphatidylglycerophosphate/cardiolipin synthase-like enzyme